MNPRSFLAAGALLLAALGCRTPTETPIEPGAMNPETNVVAAIAALELLG
jgi:hypothetical protein